MLIATMRNASKPSRSRMTNARNMTASNLRTSRKFTPSGCLESKEAPKSRESADRHDPEIHWPPGGVDGCFRLRPAEIKGFRDDAGARLQFSIQLRQQLHVERRQQIHRHHRRLADIRGKHILLHEA